MFERVGSLAERAATNVSRRAFLGQLGQDALGLAAIVGGVLAGGILAFPANARADSRGSCWCCCNPFNGSCSLQCAAQRPSVYCSLVKNGCGGCTTGRPC